MIYYNLNGFKQYFSENSTFHTMFTKVGITLIKSSSNDHWPKPNPFYLKISLSSSWYYVTQVVWDMSAWSLWFKSSKVDLYFMTGLPNTKMSSSGRRGGGGMTARHASPAHTLIMNSHTDFATWSPIFFAPEKTVENLKGRGACMTQYFCPTNREERVVTNRRTASVSQWQSVPWC